MRSSQPVRHNPGRTNTKMNLSTSPAIRFTAKLCVLFRDIHNAPVAMTGTVRITGLNKLSVTISRNNCATKAEAELVKAEVKRLAMIGRCSPMNVWCEDSGVAVESTYA